LPPAANEQAHDATIEHQFDGITIIDLAGVEHIEQLAIEWLHRSAS